MAQGNLFGDDLPPHRLDERSPEPLPPGKYALPKEFVPCIDDPELAGVLADYLEERGELAIARHIRWTAREWKWGRGMRLAELGPTNAMPRLDLPVWARFANQGWSRALVNRVTPGPIEVYFAHSRTRRRWGLRAWWDLEPRIPGKKPKPRKGYGTQKNAILAAALRGCTVQAGSWADWQYEDETCQPPWAGELSG